MQSIKQRRLAWLPVILAFGVVAAACGGDEDDASADTGEDGGASGSINISGSSTVEPISSLAAEAFMMESGDGLEIAVDGPGTGDGFELFCNGETDISDASRAIDEEEVAACEANGIEYVELQIAYDGMAVMTSVDNDRVECLNFADLYGLIGPEAEGIGTWAEAATVAGELGSTTALPDAELALTGPGTESGTYDSFIEIALEGFAEERGQEATTRTDYASSADDNTIIANIEASPTSLGWVGFAFAEEAGDSVRSLPIAAEPGGECVEPSAETISDGSYPLSRPLFIYVNTAKAEENAALADFVDFYLGNLAEFVEEGGYVTMPDDQVEATDAAWADR